MITVARIYVCVVYLQHFLSSASSSSLCISVCSWMLQALQRWPAAMLHRVVLVEKAGAVPGATLWQTEQMPYANKQPGGAASPSILPPLHQVKVLRLAAAAAKTLCPSTHYHSQHAKHPNGSLAFICLRWAAASVTCYRGSPYDCLWS